MIEMYQKYYQNVRRAEIYGLVEFSKGISLGKASGPNHGPIRPRSPLKNN